MWKLILSGLVLYFIYKIFIAPYKPYVSEDMDASDYAGRTIGHD